MKRALADLFGHRSFFFHGSKLAGKASLAVFVGMTVAVIVGLLLAAGSGRAQQAACPSGYLCGQMTDENGQGLASAIHYLDNASGSPLPDSSPQATDGGGNFELAAPTPAPALLAFLAHPLPSGSQSLADDDVTPDFYADIYVYDLPASMWDFGQVTTLPWNMALGFESGLGVSVDPTNATAVIYGMVAAPNDADTPVVGCATVTVATTPPQSSFGDLIYVNGQGQPDPSVTATDPGYGEFYIFAAPVYDSSQGSPVPIVYDLTATVMEIVDDDTSPAVATAHIPLLQPSSLTLAPVVFSGDNPMPGCQPSSTSACPPCQWDHICGQVADGTTPHCGLGPVLYLSTAQFGTAVTFVDAATLETVGGSAGTDANGCFSLSVPSGGVAGLGLQIVATSYLPSYTFSLEYLAGRTWGLTWPMANGLGTALPAQFLDCQNSSQENAFPYYPSTGLDVSVTPGAGHILGAVVTSPGGPWVGGAVVTASSGEVFYTNDNGVPLLPDVQDQLYVSTNGNNGNFWLLNATPGTVTVDVAYPSYATTTTVVANAITLLPIFVGDVGDDDTSPADDDDNDDDNDDNDNDDDNDDDNDNDTVPDGDDTSPMDQPCSNLVNGAYNCGQELFGLDPDSAFASCDAQDPTYPWTCAVACWSSSVSCSNLMTCLSACGPAADDDTSPADDDTSPGGTVYLSGVVVDPTTPNCALPPVGGATVTFLDVNGSAIAGASTTADETYGTFTLEVPQAAEAEGLKISYADYYDTYYWGTASELAPNFAFFLYPTTTFGSLTALTINPNKGIIAGAVLSGGAPLPNATVSAGSGSALYATGSSLCATPVDADTLPATSGDNGDFFLVNVDPGAQKSLSVSATGGTPPEVIPFVVQGAVTVVVYCPECLVPFYENVRATECFDLIGAVYNCALNLFGTWNLLAMDAYCMAVEPTYLWECALKCASSSSCADLSTCLSSCHPPVDDDTDKVDWSSYERNGWLPWLGQDDYYRPENCETVVGDDDTSPDVGLHNCLVRADDDLVFKMDDDDTSPAACDYAFWDFLGRNGNWYGLSGCNGAVDDDSTELLPQTLHEYWQKGRGFYKKLCYRNYVSGPIGDAPFSVGLPVDAAFMGGVDTGAPAWRHRTDDDDQIVFFFGDYEPEPPHNGSIQSTAGCGDDDAWNWAGDPFGSMPADVKPDTDLNYNNFVFARAQTGNRNSPIFHSILDAVQETDGADDIFCKPNNSSGKPDETPSEIGMWGPDGSYYDSANDVVWLWYVSNGNQWLLGLYERSNLIKVTPGPNSDFTEMHLVKGNGCDHPFSRNRFLAVTAAEVPAGALTNLSLPDSDGRIGALLFGSNPGSPLCHGNSPAYLGYFVPPPSDSDDYAFYVLNGEFGDDDASPWAPVDDDITGNDSTEATPYITGDDDAYEQMSVQMIALSDGTSFAGGHLLIFGAINYAANNFEIRFAHITDATDLQDLHDQLNGHKITSPIMGYYDQLVPGSVKLAREGTATHPECHLYYDRVTSTVGTVPQVLSCEQRTYNGSCRADGDQLPGVGGGLGESYGTAVVKSVANIDPTWIGSMDKCPARAGLE
jgi:hypothetical protein